MQIVMSVDLPHEEVTVPLVRQVLGQTLTSLGARSEERYDVQLALTEACSNVLRHTEAGEADYQVLAAVDHERCVLQVCDRGEGFVLESLFTPVDDDAEGGRGLDIIRELMDGLSVSRNGPRGAVVRLEKVMHWEPDSPVLALSQMRRPPRRPGA